MPVTMSDQTNNQTLYLVFGGELESLDDIAFRDPSTLDIVGIYPNYDLAEKAWRGAAQRTVDNAHTRYFLVDLHVLLDSAKPEKIA